MRKMFSIVFSVIVIAFVMTGCAHKITMAPKTEKIIDGVNTEKNEYNVAYYISKYDQNLEVKTPGGGGDNIVYTPYDDTEFVFRAVLAETFKKVYKIDSLSNEKFIKEKDIKLIFSYKLITNSSSPSAFTWPPTLFSISLVSSANNNKGEKVWSETFYGEGKASFDEFKHDFSLSAKRASQKVFTKMLSDLNNNKKFK